MRALAIRKFRDRKYPGVDRSIGNGLPNYDRSPKAPIQRQSGHLERRTIRGQKRRTFNPLFPKGNYFGVLATAGPGPINFIDAHPRVEATLRGCDCLRRLDLSVAGEFARRSVFPPDFYYSSRKERRTFRWGTVGHGSALAGESPSVVSSPGHGNLFIAGNSLKESSSALITSLWTEHRSKQE